MNGERGADLIARAHRLGALWLTLILMACGAQESGASTTGTLALALSTQTGGTTYRLTSATVEITGPEHRRLTTGFTSETPTLRAELMPGTYQVRLQSGWYLERSKPEGGYATVDAQLANDTETAQIEVDQTSRVSFRFTTEQGVVDFAEGALEIGIEVEERVRPWRIVKLFGGLQTGCAVLANGAFRCWGDNTRMVEAVDLDVGGLVTKVKFDVNRSCLLLANGELRCWAGQVLTSPSQLRTIDVGGDVRQFDLSQSHVCAVLASGALRCWGDGFFGALGYGNTNSISEQEIATIGDVPVGGLVSSVAVIFEQTCALMQSNTLRCWGANYWHDQQIGDNEPASAAGQLGFAAAPVELVAGSGHWLVRLANDFVVGIGSTRGLGLTDHLTSGVVGPSLLQVAAGGNTNCALLASGEIRCWGEIFGRFPTVPPVITSTPASMAATVVLPAGERPIFITPGCAVFESGRLFCWDNSASDAGTVVTGGSDAGAIDSDGGTAMP